MGARMRKPIKGAVALSPKGPVVAIKATKKAVPKTKSGSKVYDAVANSKVAEGYYNAGQAVKKAIWPDKKPKK